MELLGTCVCVSLSLSLSFSLSFFLFRVSLSFSLLPVELFGIGVCFSLFFFGFWELCFVFLSFPLFLWNFFEVSLSVSNFVASCGAIRYVCMFWSLFCVCETVQMRGSFAEINGSFAERYDCAVSWICVCVRHVCVCHVCETAQSRCGALLWKHRDLLRK